MIYNIEIGNAIDRKLLEHKQLFEFRFYTGLHEIRSQLWYNTKF